jgi:uncharacterized protein (TIGR02001 family)
MKTRFLTASLAGAMALAGFAAPAIADGEEEAASSGFSGYITLTSDYRFRGISQTDNGGALQAAVNYTHESGLYFEAWASNIDFSPFGDPDTRIEVDLTAGWAADLSDYTSMSLRAVYYMYPDADLPPGDPDYDYFEFFVGLDRKLGESTTLSLEVAYSPDTFAEGGDAWAFTGGLAFPLWQNVWFFDGIEGSGHLGNQTFEELDGDYMFWDLGLTANLDNLSFDARYIDTDLDGADCGLDACEANFVFSATLGWGG